MYYCNMENLSKAGRIFYGVAIAGMGLQSIYYGKFPYMLIPPTHFPDPLRLQLASVSGILLAFAGICIIFEKKIRLVSLLLGSALLLIFCFYYIPYEFMSGTFKQFGEWENAEKELALCGGAFVIAGCFSGKNESPIIRFLEKLIPIGIISFSLPMICFGIDHFLGPQGVADYTPAWVPFKLFWAYFCGTALIASGIAIILKIKPDLMAFLLGLMIFIWFIILHIPKVISAPADELRGEVTSAFLALAYSGIAFAIAGAGKKQI